MTTPPDGLVAHLFRGEAGRMVTRLTRALGARHLTLAEDAVQDALMQALRLWPARGVPAQPAAWLFTVARHRAVDRLRRDAWFVEREHIVADACRALTAAGLDEGRLPFGDADLCVMFLTCHPAVSRDARVALTLRTVCGCGVDEIARAYLQPAPTIAQRLVRAKRVLRETDAVVDLPDGEQMRARRPSVLEALYLMFNEGYTTHGGDRLTRPDVCDEALRLARLVATTPETAAPDASALLALFLLQSARLPARTTPQGDLLLLAEQDRSIWDRRRMAEGMHWLEASAAGPALSAYHVQAAIAATHACAPDVSRTDWARIVALFDQLHRLAPSPVVRLHRAVAVAEWQGAAAGLASLDAAHIPASFERYYLVHAVRGTLLQRVGRLEEARASLDRALALTCSEPERRLLEHRRTALTRG